MKKIVIGVVGILTILTIIFLLKSAPVDPVAYTPPKPQELEGVLAPNNLFQNSELLALGKIKVLATSADEVPFKFTDALDIANAGTIYFTDASSRYGQNEYLYLGSLHNDRIGKYKLP